MQIVHVNPNHLDPVALAQASAVLASGGVVVFPTETAYGLAADPTNRQAIKKIYAIKHRDSAKPLPLIAANSAIVKTVVKLPPPLADLAQKFWPAPLTIVAPLRWLARLYYRHLAHNGTAAIRVSPSVWATALASSCGGFVTSTSANLSNQPTIYSSSEVLSAFANHQPVPDLFLDAGNLPVQPPSTIVAWQDQQIKILRPGSLKPEL